MFFWNWVVFNRVLDEFGAGVTVIPILVVGAHDVLFAFEGAGSGAVFEHGNDGLNGSVDIALVGAIGYARVGDRSHLIFAEAQQLEVNLGLFLHLLLTGTKVINFFLDCVVVVRFFLVNGAAVT